MSRVERQPTQDTDGPGAFMDANSTIEPTQRLSQVENLALFPD